MTKIEQLRKQLITGKISISDTEIETLVEFRKLLDLVELQHEALKYHREQTRPIQQTTDARTAFENWNKP